MPCIYMTLFALLSIVLSTRGFSVKPSRSLAGFAFLSPRIRQYHHDQSTLLYTAQSESSNDTITNKSSPTPNLDGKRVLPYKILMGGIKGHRVAAVYAVMNAYYQRGSNGWDMCVYVGVTQDLMQSLQNHSEKHGTEQVAYIRSLTFSTPEPIAMQQVVKDWRDLADQARANLKAWDVDVMEYLYDNEHDDDDDDDDDFDREEADLLAARTTEAKDIVYIRHKDAAPDEAVVSPFDSALAKSDMPKDMDLVLTLENVDRVLNEVRPYLIADGGNVKVERVDENEKNVYLKLEGACGSCESSTVTMQMGIERTLKENFADLQQVIRVESDADKPSELTWKVVEDEVNRLLPAILAMGGQCDVVNVDATTGVVDIQFRGASKVRGGLELALLDIPLLNKVNFVMGEN